MLSLQHQYELDKQHREHLMREVENDRLAEITSATNPLRSAAQTITRLMHQMNAQPQQSTTVHRELRKA